MCPSDCARQICEVPVHCSSLLLDELFEVVGEFLNVDRGTEWEIELCQFGICTVIETRFDRQLLFHESHQGLDAALSVQLFDARGPELESQCHYFVVVK